MLHQELEGEDEILLALAGLKQVGLFFESDAFVKVTILFTNVRI